MIRSLKPPAPMPAGHVTGRRAEDVALQYLGDRGLELLERNYRSRRGELDLVMQDRDCIVFVEVRFRRSTRFGGAIESIDRRKRDKLIVTARQYLQACGHSRWKESRFDVVCVFPAGDTISVEWIRDAFDT